jgi:hypothetical protein
MIKEMPIKILSEETNNEWNDRSRTRSRIR